MPKAHNPRHGSMQFWPRKRAKRIYPKIRAWSGQKDAQPLGFAGYKVGMAHVAYIDNRKTSKTKGEEISCPVTVVECPPLKIFSALFYKYDVNKWILKKEVSFKADKELGRKLKLSAKKEGYSLDNINLTDYDDIRIKVYTQPKLTTIGKKKPDVFELHIGGSKEEKFAFVKDNAGKDIRVGDVFKPGQLLDFHAVTKGKGFQGPVKRFGVSIRHHKSEKTKRGPGSLGSWCGQGHMMYRVAHAGQMGYHTRTEYNKWLLKISDKPDDINPKCGFIRYGVVRNEYILVKGSVNGPKKRLVRFTHPMRPNTKTPKEAPSIVEVS
ncbi:MAG: 50S ribosomal protein L3 [Candidatus Woesearchaeota archaeon]